MYTAVLSPHRFVASDALPIRFEYCAPPFAAGDAA